MRIPVKIYKNEEQEVEDMYRNDPYALAGSRRAGSRHVRGENRKPVYLEDSGNDNAAGRPWPVPEDDLTNSSEAEYSESRPDREAGIDMPESPEANWKDMYVRLLADFENYKRHAEAERGRLAGIGKESVLDDLFPVLEHMERAIKTVSESGGDNGVLQGLEMVRRGLVGLMEKHGVERIPAVGEPFDPARHEAVSMVRRPDVPEGVIIEEIKPGFIRDGKLLRPATVVVAR